MEINNKGWNQIIELINYKYRCGRIIKENIINDKGLYFHFTRDHRLNPSIAIWNYNRAGDFCYGAYNTDGHNGLDRVSNHVPIFKIFQNDCETTRRFLKLLDESGLFKTRFRLSKYIKTDLFDFINNRNDKWFVLNNSLINTILNSSLKEEG